MRRIVVSTMLSLDGVMQAPGGPEEDKSGGFKYGGWVAPFADEVGGAVFRKQMESADLLLGRKTFEIFAGYWPEHEEGWPGVNDVTKYVLSKTMKKADWQNTEFLKNVADIENLKKSDGGDIQVWGSAQLVQLLLKHDLVDELWLKTYPVVLGEGKKLFNDEAMPRAFTVTESVVTPTGVVLATYKRAGEVQTGTAGE